MRKIAKGFSVAGLVFSNLAVLFLSWYAFNIGMYAPGLGVVIFVINLFAIFSLFNSITLLFKINYNLKEKKWGLLSCFSFNLVGGLLYLKWVKE